MKEAVEKIVKVFKRCGGSEKNTSILSKLTDVTFWLNVRIMLEHFIRIHAELMELQDRSETVKKNHHMIAIDKVTKVLQTRCQTFSKARRYVED